MSTFERIDLTMHGDYSDDIRIPVSLAKIHAYNSELDRLHSLLPTWTTVTDEIETLPYDQGTVVVIPADYGKPFFTDHNRDIRPGDRWCPIPQDGPAL